MSGQQFQFFGGDWTEQKLEALDRYLTEYVKVMKNQPFECIYIDAFAGTGYREKETSSLQEGFFAEELTEPEPQEFFDGSARKALRVVPPFHRYLFVERSAKRFTQLVKLRDEFPALAERMDFRKEDCNLVLQDLCRKWSRNTRGVLFLDPFGMQVDWSTLQAVASTRAIDVWILFPLGMGVNRMLARTSGQIPQSWRARLDRFFGTAEWFERFYKPSTIQGLFGDEPKMIRSGSFNAIADYYQERLHTIFADVANNPRVLRNTRGNPLFLLCFAVGNPSPKARKIALSIAQYILGMD